MEAEKETDQNNQNNFIDLFNDIPGFNYYNYDDTID